MNREKRAIFTKQGKKMDANRRNNGRVRLRR
jgi:hypothetical protein